MKRTFNPSNLHRKRVHGFRARMATKGGRLVLAVVARRAASASQSDRFHDAPDRPRAPPRFARASRLTDKPQFDAVHRQGQRSSDALFMVITRTNETGRARLGLSVGVKAAGNSVGRNRIKRLVRESFRHRQQEMPSVDLVVNARAAAAKSTNDEIRASLAAHWDRIVRRCARS